MQIKYRIQLHSKHMNRVSIIVCYLCSICLLACLTAYPIYLATGAELERIVSRSILIYAVLLFYPICQLLKVPNFSSLGFKKNSITHSFSKAVPIGFLMLIPISLFFINCGYRYWETFPDSLITPLITIIFALLSGLIIGLIEESLFRGLIQTQLSAALNTFWSVIFVSAIYSSVHFLQANELNPSESIHWFSSFIILKDAFANLAIIPNQMDSWIALFLAGIFLSIVRIRTDNLWWCIGIHAGWVMHIKLFKSFTDRNSDAVCSSLASDYDKYIGELSTIWIVALIICWFLFIKFKNSTQR